MNTSPNYKMILAVVCCSGIALSRLGLTRAMTTSLLLAAPVQAAALLSEQTACPLNRLPLAEFYWQEGRSQFRWQATDQQLGWLSAQAPVQLAELADEFNRQPARPVRQQTSRNQQDEQLFWQLPNGRLHAARLSGGQLAMLWQVPMSANPGWLPAPLTLLTAPLAGQRAASRSAHPQQDFARLLLSSASGHAVQLIHLQDGRIESIQTPSQAGTAIANPLAFDTDQNGDVDRIYFVNSNQQIWRLDWLQSDQWQPTLIARLADTAGIADAALQGWPAHWPLPPTANRADVQSSARMSPVTAQPAPAVRQPANAWLSAQRPRQHTGQGELLLLLTRQTRGYGLLLLKVSAGPGTVIDVEPDTDSDSLDADVHIKHAESYWFLRFHERPVSLPVVLGSVVYLPVSAPSNCLLPGDYQQVLALNLFNGAPVYTTRYLAFTQPQTAALKLREGPAGFSLGTATETLLPQVRLIDPQCQYCVRPMTTDALSQRRWLAGYLAEEAF